MKQSKKVFSVLWGLMFMLVFSLSSDISIVKATENPKSTSQEYADAMAPGWNLGNTFDGFDTNGDKGEESWGNPIVTKELIKTIKTQGFNSIRMPFTSVMRTGDAPDYKIDPKFLARYAEVVNWALEEDLYVMINLHHDSWNWGGNIGADWDNGASMARYKAIWTQLANYFKDYPDKVCFESLNEPQYWFGEVADQIKINTEVNEVFYNIVRKSGGNNTKRMLVLPTLNTNDSQDKCDALYNAIKGFNDKNIIATFHYYGYWPFSVNIAGATTFDEIVIKELEDAFNRVHNTFTKNGMGVICGEYGLLAFDSSLDAVEHGEVLKYFEYINYYAKEKDITMMLWDNGQHLNRKTYTWSDQSLYDVIKASQTSRSSYATSDRIFIKESEKQEDVVMKLTLNGNTLKAIADSKRELVLGKDYTYANETVTFKGDYIKGALTEGYGINETLTLKFSAGVNWKIDITHYKAPVLSEAKGTTAGFTLPIAFNGARLSTLEALYADGSIAGPQNWTSFKEFAYTFLPDYDKNTILIKDKFFEETTDGDLYLTLHLQSGETIAYKLTKKGTEVTGTTKFKTNEK